MDEGTPLVRYEASNGVARITIDREERRNALSNATIAALHAAFDRADADPAVRAIVLTGAGERAFCAGGDLSGGPGIFAAEDTQTTLPLGNLLRRVRRIEVPVIARVNGTCMAGGVALLAMCDLAVADDRARFGLPEARIGIFPMQVVAVLKELLRPRDLYELTMCAAPIDAARAREIGLVNRVVPRERLDDTVNELIAQLLLGAPSALRRGKYTLAAMAPMPFEQAIAFAEGQVTLMATTSDVQEGVTSFQEKREPRWARS